MPRLVLRNAILDDHVHGIAPGITLIGRSTECALTLSDAGVSRFHSRLEWSDGQVTIEDLGSSNGTYVNGELVAQRRTLADGDSIRIGTVSAQYFADPEPAVPPPELVPVTATTAPREASPRLWMRGVTSLAILVIGGAAVWASLATFERRERAAAERFPEIDSPAPAAARSDPTPESVPDAPLEDPELVPVTPPPLPTSPRRPEPREDRVRLQLRDGSALEGRLLDEDAAAVQIWDAASGRPRRVAREEIATRDGVLVTPDLDAIFDARLAVAADLRSLTELLAWCQRHGRSAADHHHPAR